MMKKYLLAIGVAAAVGGSANAADLAPAYKAPPPAVCPTCNWTGFYLGANVGGSFGHDETSNTNVLAGPGFVPPAGFNPVSSSNFTFNPVGVLGGAQAGYNWQVSSVVYGLEGDWQWSGQSDSINNFAGGPVIPSPGTASRGSFSTDQSIKWIATARARLGFAANCSLWYVTGGAAWGKVDSDASVSNAQFFGPGAVGGSFSDTKVGWTVGGGVETSFTWLGLSPNWSAKLEYLYVDLGDVNTSFSANNIAAGAGFTNTFLSSSRIEDHIVRVGLNYRWNWVQ
jgi:outer membrane immunogenic protein